MTTPHPHGLMAEWFGLWASMVGVWGSNPSQLHRFVICDMAGYRAGIIHVSTIVENMSVFDIFIYSIVSMNVRL